MSKTHIKRSMKINGHRTSVALEPEFWAAVEALAAKRGLTIPRFIGEIDKKRDDDMSLASALRCAVLPAPERMP